MPVYSPLYNFFLPHTSRFLRGNWFGRRITLQWRRNKLVNLGVAVCVCVWGGGGGGGGVHPNFDLLAFNSLVQ